MPRYAEYRVFPDPHLDTITRVAFNPDGKLMASASLDGSLCIWNVKSSSLCHQYFTGHSVLSILWADDERILCGLDDGSVACMVINSETKTLDVTGTWGHSYPVEILALTKNRLASGAHEELFIWRWNYNAVMSYQEREVTFPADCKTEKDVLVTALHWSDTGDGGSASLLIVGYMHHGVRGSAAVSPDNKYIAVSDMFTGFHIYSLDDGDLFMRFEQEAKEAWPVPVTWLHGGRAILGGSTISCISIWYVDGSGCVIRLPVPGSTKVLGVTAHYNSITNTFLVACGTETEDHKISAVIWRAKKRKGNDVKLPDDNQDDGNDNDNDCDDNDNDNDNNDNNSNNDDEESLGLESATPGRARFSWSFFMIALAIVIALQFARDSILNFSGSQD